VVADRFFVGSNWCAEWHHYQEHPGRNQQYDIHIPKISHDIRDIFAGGRSVPVATLENHQKERL
jgi:hypothetical protein